MSPPGPGRVKMLTDRSFLLCHFPKLVDFSPVSCVQLPKSLIIISFSGANLYISQILAKSFSIKINRNKSSSISKGRVFSIDEALATFWKAEISMNQYSLSLLVLSFILLSRHFRLGFTLLESTMYMWRSSFATNSFLVELEIVWKRNEKVLSSLKRYKGNYKEQKRKREKKNKMKEVNKGWHLKNSFLSPLSSLFIPTTLIFDCGHVTNLLHYVFSWTHLSWLMDL